MVFHLFLLALADNGLKFSKFKKNKYVEGVSYLDR